MYFYECLHQDRVIHRGLLGQWLILNIDSYCQVALQKVYDRDFFLKGLTERVKKNKKKIIKKRLVIFKLTKKLLPHFSLYFDFQQSVASLPSFIYIYSPQFIIQLS